MDPVDEIERVVELIRREQLRTPCIECDLDLEDARILAMYDAVARIRSACAAMVADLRADEEELEQRRDGE